MCRTIKKCKHNLTHKVCCDERKKKDHIFSHFPVVYQMVTTNVDWLEFEHLQPNLDQMCMQMDLIAPPCTSSLSLSLSLSLSHSLTLSRCISLCLSRSPLFLLHPILLFYCPSFLFCFQIPQSLSFSQTQTYTALRSHPHISSVLNFPLTSLSLSFLSLSSYILYSLILLSYSHFFSNFKFSFYLFLMIILAILFCPTFYCNFLLFFFSFILT